MVMSEESLQEFEVN